MKQVKHTFSPFYMAWFVWLILMAWFLIGCRATPATEEFAAVITPVPPTATAVPPTATPTPTPSPVPNPCLDCHTNKERLIDTADPEEEVISENEGEG